MDLYSTPASPFARKVRIVAIETGQADDVRVLDVAFTPVRPDRELIAHNPVAKVPTLVTDDGVAIYDSRVICEYLDARRPGGKLFPADGAARWNALRLQAIGDAIMDAGVMMRYEVNDRPGELYWQDWFEAQKAKALRAVDTLEGEIAGLEGGLNIGVIAVACALSYLDFRFAEQVDWRDGHPGLAAWYRVFARRPAMQATVLTG